MYKHTQIGWGSIFILGFFSVLLIGMTIAKKADLFACGIFLLALIMFAKLTITVDDQYIRLVFGFIGFPRRKFKLEDVTSSRPVKSIMIGIILGIHYGSRDSLYNVSGQHAVELTMKNGRTVRIGTNDPVNLSKAVEGKIKADRRQVREKTWNTI